LVNSMFIEEGVREFILQRGLWLFLTLHFQGTVEVVETVNQYRALSRLVQVCCSRRSRWGRTQRHLAESKVDRI